MVYNTLDVETGVIFAFVVDYIQWWINTHLVAYSAFMATGHCMEGLTQSGLVY